VLRHWSRGGVTCSTGGGAIRCHNGSGASISVDAGHIAVAL